MQALQRIYSSSVVYPKLPFDFENEIFKETSDYIKKRLPSIGDEEVKPQRNLEETSAILRVIEDIKLLKDVYIFKQAKEIDSYLWNNQFLLDILFEAHMQIVNIFGKSAELHLELHQDYEEDFKELFIVIKSPIEPTHMLDLLDRLDEEWFLDISDKTLGKLNITVESL